MDRQYWLKQTAEAPLFPDMLWSRPENRAFAGKLLVFGGNAYGFAGVAEAYARASQAGVGSIRVLLPDALRKSVGMIIEAGEYAPSTPSGSFAANALGELLPFASWADGVLLPGDLGRNSETAVLLEKFLGKYHGQLTLTKDAIEYITSQPALVRERPDTLLVLSFSQLQKFVTSLKLPLAITSSMDLLRTIDALHDLTTLLPLAIITRHLDTTLVSVGGQVSTTACPTDEKIWRLRTACQASVWWLQNPTKAFPALTTSLVAS